ncbi:SpoIVB peptidase [Caloramator proteoclasticus]|uniref:Stage IV sporulation protein B n=1 Tax=Caloramator proteoclasticus DSM 10124 TaxID=1121262 RepID=A0A1M4Y6Z4_9CLOT|nr:SpoIVB peptidase [Caloramator proteoclasticus]SHF01353.1 stage IV sporulation protein B [Caloramator proteoclasticus DSM 10124]
MKTKAKKSAKFMLFTIIIFLTFFMSYINQIPSSINVTKDINYIKLTKSNIIKLTTSDIDLVSSQNKNSVKGYVKLFGLVPIKEVTINFNKDRKVYAGGHSIGVKLYTEGVLVVGFSDIETNSGKKQSPAVVSNVQIGDMIVEINGKRIKYIKDLSEEISKSNGNALNLKLKRRDKYIDTTINPVLNKNNQYKLGMWVRDSTSGIGTLTFVDPKLKKFAALGHPINDIDTGQLLTVREGSIYKAKVIDITKGEKGKPGELRGAFSEDDEIGNLTKNTLCGIYGSIKNLNDFVKSNSKEYIIASQNEIKEGPAKILVEVDDDVKEYNINIEKINKQSSPNSKSMVIRIIDKNLIEKTGGIVQGMSGSPIIQDDKLVGAVTHVFVNRPDMGYAIFAEWMYNELDDGF